MRVLSPRIEPPVRVEDGSMASTATRWPRPVSMVPRASSVVDLPTPGGPVRPSRTARPVAGSTACRSARAVRRCSALRDSTSVMARAKTARSPRRRASAMAATSPGAGRGIAAPYCGGGEGAVARGDAAVSRDGAHRAAGAGGAVESGGEANDGQRVPGAERTAGAGRVAHGRGAAEGGDEVAQAAQRRPEAPDRPRGPLRRLLVAEVSLHDDADLVPARLRRRRGGAGPQLLAPPLPARVYNRSEPSTGRSPPGSRACGASASSAIPMTAPSPRSATRSAPGYADEGVAAFPRARARAEGEVLVPRVPRLSRERGHHHHQHPPPPADAADRTALPGRPTSSTSPARTCSPS